MRTYYKFYSLIDEEKRNYLKEAIRGGSIHMGSYTEVGTNDDKEGHFILDKPLEESFRKRLKEEKMTYMIGCASKRLENTYMWERFANGDKGACLAFSCIDTEAKPYDINYVDGLPEMTKSEFEKLSIEEQVSYALLHKRKQSGNELYWKEEEVRYLKKIFENKEKDNDKMSITIDAIYLGWNMERKDITCWKNLADSKGINVILLQKAFNN